jgi:hypothetical protein
MMDLAWRPVVQPTRVFLASPENPVPMRDGESYWDYSQRLLATGRARDWQTAKDRWAERQIVDQLIAHFGREAAQKHLLRLARFDAASLHPQPK